MSDSKEQVLILDRVQSLRSYLQKLTKLRNPLLLFVSILSACLFWSWVTYASDKDHTKKAMLQEIVNQIPF